ncbi:MAG: hypothetical protein WCH43_09455 [Verrucomicrobiota bacterium]
MSSTAHSPWQIEGRDPYGESDTRAKLIDPAIYGKGWTEEHIRREETAGGIEVVDGEARRNSRGRVDYTLRVKVSATAQPVAISYIEAKAENKPPTQGLQQGKDYAAASKRLNVPCVRNIVFLQYVRSPIVFHQMIGRGTRIYADKLMFRVFDYTDATSLLGSEFKTKFKGSGNKKKKGPEPERSFSMSRCSLCSNR